MLTAKQQKCIEMLISGNYKKQEIADDLKVTVQTLCNWEKNTEFIEEYEKANRDAFRKLVPKARQKIADLLNAKNEQVQLAAARDILDRAGYKAESKVQVEGSLTTETTKLNDLIEQMKK